MNEGWEFLKNEILKAQYQTVPMKRRNGRNQKRPRYTLYRLIASVFSEKEKDIQLGENEAENTGKGIN